MYDLNRLLVAYTSDSDTCRTPHFTSDLLTALRDEDVTLKRLSFTNGYEVELLVNGCRVAIHATDGSGTLSVRHKDKFVLASCARQALVPSTVAGASLLTLFADKYGAGARLTDLDDELEQFSLTAKDVVWTHVSYLEAKPIVDAIRMLIPESSAA